MSPAIISSECEDALITLTEQKMFVYHKALTLTPTFPKQILE